MIGLAAYIVVGMAVSMTAAYHGWLGKHSQWDVTTPEVRGVLVVFSWPLAALFFGAGVMRELGEARREQREIERREMQRLLRQHGIDY